MKKLLIYIFYIVLCFYKIKCMYFFADGGKTVCLSQKKKKNENFRLTYYLSGAKEDGNLITIFSPSNKKEWESQEKKNDKLSIVTKEDGNYKFCVKNNAKSRLTITFQFPKEVNSSQILTVENIDNFDTAIKAINKKLNTIQFNIRNTAVRRGEHSKITRNILFKVSIYSYLKMGFLIIFSIFQIWIVTTIFKDFQIINKISINSKSELSKLKETEDDKEHKKPDVFL